MLQFPDVDEGANPFCALSPAHQKQLADFIRRKYSDAARDQAMMNGKLALSFYNEMKGELGRKAARLESR